MGRIRQRGRETLKIWIDLTQWKGNSTDMDRIRQRGRETLHIWIELDRGEGKL